MFVSVSFSRSAAVWPVSETVAAAGTEAAAKPALRVTSAQTMTGCEDSRLALPSGAAPATHSRAPQLGKSRSDDLHSHSHGRSHSHSMAHSHNHSHSQSHSRSPSHGHSHSRLHSPRATNVVLLSATAREFSPANSIPASPLSARTAPSPRAASVASIGFARPASRAASDLEDVRVDSAGLPTAPVEDADAEQSRSAFARELPAHLSYLLHFRVAVCSAYLNGACPADAYGCFHSHARTPKRRRPTIHHSRFNYLPTRCRYISEEAECPQGPHCRFAHTTEEVIYHPSKFKTQLCSHRADAETGCCAGYGQHCAKAHGQQELRVPLFEVNDEAPLPHYDREHHLRVFACPPQHAAIERQFYQYKYKTQPCAGFPFTCECDGFDYHRPEERRRGPVVNYAPLACPNVKPFLNSEWGNPNVDCSGKHQPKVFNGTHWVPQPSEVWDCELSHTLLEQMYHPVLFKTSQCDKFDVREPAAWKCVWKRRCAHAHGESDARGKDDALEQWRQHLQQHAEPALAHALLAKVQAQYQSQSQPIQHSAAFLALPRSPNGAASPGPGCGHHSRSVSQPLQFQQQAQHSAQPSAAATPSLWAAPVTALIARAESKDSSDLIVHWPDRTSASTAPAPRGSHRRSVTLNDGALARYHALYTPSDSGLPPRRLELIDADGSADCSSGASPSHLASLVPADLWSQGSSVQASTTPSPKHGRVTIVVSVTGAAPCARDWDGWPLIDGLMHAQRVTVKCIPKATLTRTQIDALLDRGRRLMEWSRLCPCQLARPLLAVEETEHEIRIARARDEPAQSVCDMTDEQRHATLTAFTAALTSLHAAGLAHGGFAPCTVTRSTRGLDFGDADWTGQAAIEHDRRRAAVLLVHCIANAHSHCHSLHDARTQAPTLTLEPREWMARALHEQPSRASLPPAAVALVAALDAVDPHGAPSSASASDAPLAAAVHAHLRAIRESFSLTPEAFARMLRSFERAAV